MLHLADDTVIERILDDQPACRRAALASAQKGRLYDQHRGAVDIIRIPGNDRVVAAHFQSQYLVRAGGKLAVEGNAGAGRTGKQNAVQPFVGGQLLAGGWTAMQYIDNAGRKAGLFKRIDQILTNGRSLFRRFEDNCIAGNERRNDMPVGQMGGKIIWADSTSVRDSQSGLPVSREISSASSSPLVRIRLE